MPYSALLKQSFLASQKSLIFDDDGHLVNKDKKMKQTGLVHIYTGDGKGKTTAALGLVIRARGAGLKVLFAQLFKKESSEVKVLEKIGMPFLQYDSKHPFFKEYSEEELRNEAEKCDLFVKKVFDKLRKEKHDLVVIDELGPAIKAEFLETKEVVELIKSKPEKTELIMTGRGFPGEIIELADYVTEMKMIKHPFNKGIHARRGVEF